MPTPEQLKKVKRLNPEDLDRLGLPRTSVVISPGFAKPSKSRPGSGTPLQQLKDL
jgi:hypothetical protein